MAIIKLPNAGDQHQMAITVCEVARGNYGEQIKFEDGNDTLYLPKDSADRQLKRIFGDDFAYTDAVGNTLVFSRTPNTKSPGASPYWNIAPATGAQKAAAKTPANHGPDYYADERVKRGDAVVIETDDPFTRRKQIAEAYCALYTFVQQAAGSAITPEAAQAATATIWITWDKRGIQPDGRTPHGHKPTRVAYNEPEQEPAVKMPEPSGKRLPPPAAAAPDFSKFPPQNDADDDLPF